MLNQKLSTKMPSLLKVLPIALFNPFVAWMYGAFNIYILNKNPLTYPIIFTVMYIPFSILAHFLTAVLKAFIAARVNKKDLKELILYQYESVFLGLNLCAIASFLIVFLWIGWSMAFFFFVFLIMNAIIQFSYELYMVITKKETQHA